MLHTESVPRRGPRLTCVTFGPAPMLCRSVETAFVSPWVTLGSPGRSEGDLQRSSHCVVQLGVVGRLPHYGTLSPDRVSFTTLRDPLLLFLFRRNPGCHCYRCLILRLPPSPPRPSSLPSPSRHESLFPTSPGHPNRVVRTPGSSSPSYSGTGRPLLGVFPGSVSRSSCTLFSLVLFYA